MLLWATAHTCFDAHTFLLDDNGLAGFLPSELEVFTSLTELSLSGNSLTGNFPDTLADLNLEEIDVERNQMSGDPFPILTQIETLSRLRLSSNGFTGTLPAAISAWDRMVELWLADNNFSGPLPAELGLLTSLQTLFVYGNDFSGPLPSALGNLQLTAFQAHENRLNGEIPIELYNVTTLEFLRLDVNEFVGSLPPEIGQLTLLEDLRLANNSFTGALPPSFFGLNRLRTLHVCPSLVVGQYSAHPCLLPPPTGNVVLRFNQFSGSLRDGFSSWQNLTFFDVAYNQIGGFLPPTLFDVPTIRFAYFHFNSFVGGIPDNYGNPPRLRDLYLNNNQLDGEVPGITGGQLLELNEFLLQENLLVGQMPASVCALRTNGDLDDLYADCNPPENPEIVCPRPACCNLCFPLSAQDEGGATSEALP